MKALPLKFSSRPWLTLQSQQVLSFAGRGPVNVYLRHDPHRMFSCSSLLRENSQSDRERSNQASSGGLGSIADQRPSEPPLDWDRDPNFNISKFSDLPSTNFGVNQHMIINAEFKEALRQILWQFKAPIRYAFAYGSGVFPQSAVSSASATSVHPHPSKAVTKVQGQTGKMIDFIFGVSYTQHWHSLNLHQHRDHYSGLGSLGSGFVKRVQDGWGAGVYFNPFVTANGTLIKYGVVNLDTLCKDLSEWNTLYLAGRLQKPVKILRDDPRVRLANQVNLLSAVRTALLLLPETFTEKELYTTIANISYMGDPRMALPTEDRGKVANIVNHQVKNFRYLYAPLINDLPNVGFTDSRCTGDWADDTSLDAQLKQDMDPIRRGNMVRRLPLAFRSKLYFRYQSKFQIPGREFAEMMEKAKDEDSDGIRRRQGGEFERRIAKDDASSLKTEVSEAIKKISAWPATSQSIKSFFTAGVGRSWRYMKEKQEKYKQGKKKEADKNRNNPAKKLMGPPPSEQPTKQPKSNSAYENASKTDTETKRPSEKANQ